jgi:hypothetical protein
LLPASTATASASRVFRDTALAVIGAEPDWANVTERCRQVKTHVCEQIRAKEFPGPVTRDLRVKAAVIARPAQRVLYR